MASNAASKFILQYFAPDQRAAVEQMLSECEDTVSQARSAVTWKAILFLSEGDLDLLRKIIDSLIADRSRASAYRHWASVKSRFANDPDEYNKRFAKVIGGVALEAILAGLDCEPGHQKLALCSTVAKPDFEFSIAVIPLVDGTAFITRDSRALEFAKTMNALAECVGEQVKLDELQRRLRDWMR
jgi:hypothetical protein